MDIRLHVTAILFACCYVTRWGKFGRVFCKQINVAACRFQNECNKVEIALRVVQFWSEIKLVITNRTPASRSCDFVITRLLSDQIALHSVQLPLLNKRGIQSFMVTEVVSDNEQAQYHISVDSLKDLSCTCKIIYFHAELCVKNKSFFSALKSTAFQKRVKCVVVDEAHLIKEWYECLINLHECPFYSTA